MNPSEPKRKNLFSWIALGVLLAPLLLIASRVVMSGSPDLAVEGDLAMLDISTRNIAEGRSLLGPYSRFGFNHPGPLYLLLRLPLCLLTGWSGSASYITVPILIALCLAASFTIVRRLSGKALSVVFCLLALLYLLRSSPVVWLRDWNPFVIIFPFLLFVLSCAAVASGRTAWFPAAVICGSLVAQTHLGGAPVVLILLFLVVPVRRLFGRGGANSTAGLEKAVVVGAVFGVLLWLPVLVEELAPGQGNVSRMIGFMRENPTEVGLRAALREWSGALTSPEIGLLAPRELRSRGVFFQVVFALAAARLILIAGCAAVLRKTGRNSFIASLAALLAAAQIVMFLAVLQVRGELNEYLFCWFSVTSPLSWLVFIGTISAYAREGSPRFGFLPPLLAMLMVPVAIRVVNRLDVFGAGPFDPLRYHDETVAHLSDCLGAFLDGLDGPVCFLEPTPRELWPLSAGVVNRLAGRGYDIQPDPFFGSLTGTTPPPDAMPLVLAGAGASDPAAMDTVCIRDGFIVGLPGALR